MSDDRHEAGIEAAHEAYRREGLSGPAHDAQLRDAVAAYKQAAGLVDRESLVAEIVAWLRGRTGAHGGGFTSADDVAEAIDYEFSARPARTPEPQEGEDWRWR